MKHHPLATACLLGPDNYDTVSFVTTRISERFAESLQQCSMSVRMFAPAVMSGVGLRAI